MRWMTSPLTTVPLLALALLLAATAASAQEARQLAGTLGPGGRFQLAIPAGWQAGDALIVYNHGFTLDSGDLLRDPELAPADAVLEEWLRRGYAVAAGSYAQRGWALFSLAEHQRALLQRFTTEAGAPGRIVLVGGSLGGLVSVKTAESLFADGQPVDGIFALCPAFAGARTWDGAADLKLVYDTVCDGVGGGEIDRAGSAPAWVLDYAQVPEDWGDRTDEEVQRLAARLTQCTGALLPEWARSSGQQQRLDRIMGEFGLTDVDNFVTNMAYATFAVSDLVRAPDKLRGHSPFDNRNVTYSDATVDAGIERVDADRYARAELEAVSDPDWTFGDARLLAVHTSRDEVVVPEHLSLVQALADASPTVATALVVEDTPTHCGFRDAEFLAGFDALEDWMDGAPEPNAAALDARCEDLTATLGGECRFADASGVASYDARIAPRALATFAPVAAPQSGAWYDPASDGEGFVVQVLPGRGEAAVTWYTYAPDGSGEQRWITGVGIVEDNAIVVQDAWIWTGGGFGTGFDPDAVQGTRWGRLTFLIEEPLIEEPLAGSDTLRHGRVRYEGPAGWGSGERILSQISHDGCGTDACNPAALALHAWSGLWYRGPDAPGDGLFLQVDDEGLAVVAWYLYAPDGAPMWLIGTQQVAAGSDAVSFELVRAQGATFGDAFDPAQVQRSAWGEATLSFDGCDAATLEWQANDAAFPDGSIALQRLTPAPAGTACAGD